MFGWRKRPQGLDEPLFHWTANDPFTVRALLNSMAIFGRTGSGKTSYSGKKIASCIVKNPQSAGLILTAKPEDRRMWEKIFEACGRSDDLKFFGPEESATFNVIDYESSRGGGHTRNITRAIMTISETLRAGDSDNREDGDFWQREQSRLIHNAVEIIRRAIGKVSGPDLQKFISGAAKCQAELGTDSWRTSYHAEMIGLGNIKAKTASQQHDFELAIDFWVNEFPNMSDRTRSSIMTGVMGILHVFNTGVVRELVSTGTTLSPDDILAGKYVLIDAAPSQWGDIGSFLNAAWKYATQRAVLRRAATPDDPFVCMWVDEAQQFVNSHDAVYIAQSRSHLGCLVFLTQSIHSLYAALKGKSGEHQAEALLSNFSCKLFHALGDAFSAEFASKLIGRRMQTFIGGSMPPQESLWDEMLGMSRITSSFSEHIENIVEPVVFLNGLRTGGPSGVSDAIVIRSGEPFASGANHLQVSFTHQ